MNYRKPGINLQELTIGITLLGIIALFAIPLVFHQKQTAEVAAKRENATQSIISAVRHADSELGYLPADFGPARVLSKYANQIQEVASPGGNIGACPTGDGNGEKTYQLIDGTIVTNLSPSWLEDADLDPSNGKKPGDMACLALRGEKSAILGEDAVWVYIPRSGIEIRKFAQAPPPIVPPAAAPSQGPAAAPVTQVQADKEIGFISWFWNSGANSVKDIMSYYSKTKAHKTVYQTIEDSMSDFFGKNDNKVLNSYYEYQEENIRMLDSDGSELGDISYQDFLKGLSVNGQSWSKTRESFLAGDSWGVSNFLEFQRKHFLSSGRSDEYLIFKSFIFDKFFYDGPEALASQNIIYTNPSTGQTYKINTGFFSPVKIHLHQQDASLNSNDHFQVDPDGFKNTTISPIVTTGGLNPNEAWLVADRNGDGYFKKGVLDGADLFGDHLGRFTSGYEDLSHRYATYLKTDEKGRRYLDLEQITAWQRLNRLLSYKKPHPSELRLLTRDKRLFPAYKVLKRIYVDYDPVFESDENGSNQIRQRAMVVYQNGVTGQSADQWFKALQPNPAEQVASNSRF